MSVELIVTVTGYGADPTRRGPNVLVYKCGSLQEEIFSFV